MSSNVDPDSSGPAVIAKQQNQSSEADILKRKIEIIFNGP